MRHIWLEIFVCAVMFAACGDDDSDFATRPDGRESSSSVAPQSSSSVKSSSSAKSSSLAKSSSSSVTLAIPCKTDSTDTCEYGELLDDRDGQTYKTVKIGNQWWMAENLNFETLGGYCYNDSAESCTMYGRLYTWTAAKTACPTGWHLPTDVEFKTLFTAVGGSSTARKMLKSTSGWYNGGNGTDAYSFSALPVGYRDYCGYFYNEGDGAYFWSSTENDSFSAYRMNLYYRDGNTILDYNNEGYGYSVRCVKD